MKTKKTITNNILLLAFIMMIAMVSCKKDSKKEDNVADTSKEYVELATTETCECESSWFPHSNTPAPAEGKGSPFDVSSTTNCIFHQWSWQKFLWLTKTEGSLPLFLDQTKVIQVSDEMIVVDQQQGANVVLTDTAQAGFSNPYLKTNAAYNSQSNTSYTVYYSIHTSDIMLEAAQKFRDSLIAKTLAPDNLSTFPVGSLELKVSWVDANAIPSDKRGNYYTTTGALSPDYGKTFVNTEVALLGMHVVGVVENHPEFIWATFEHNDLAPNYDWEANTASTTSQKLLFLEG